MSAFSDKIKFAKCHFGSEKTNTDYSCEVSFFVQYSRFNTVNNYKIHKDCISVTKQNCFNILKSKVYPVSWGTKNMTVKTG